MLSSQGMAPWQPPMFPPAGTPEMSQLDVGEHWEHPGVASATAPWLKTAVDFWDKERSYYEDL